MASWETRSRQSLPQISEKVSLSPLFRSLISAWSVTSRLWDLWRQRIRCWCWVLTLGSEVWLRKPPSLLPSPLLCSLCIRFFSLPTQFFFTFLSLWLRDIWQKLQSFMKFKSWRGSNRKRESPFACLKDLTAGRQLDKKQPLTPALQSDFQW